MTGLGLMDALPAINVEPQISLFLSPLHKHIGINLTKEVKDLYAEKYKTLI